MTESITNVNTPPPAAAPSAPSSGGPDYKNWGWAFLLTVLINKSMKAQKLTEKFAEEQKLAGAFQQAFEKAMNGASGGKNQYYSVIEYYERFLQSDAYKNLSPMQKEALSSVGQQVEKLKPIAAQVEKLQEDMNEDSKQIQYWSDKLKSDKAQAAWYAERIPIPFYGYYAAAQAAKYTYYFTERDPDNISKYSNLLSEAGTAMQKQQKLGAQATGSITSDLTSNGQKDSETGNASKQAMVNDMDGMFSSLLSILK